jgi:TonB family protein
MLPALLAWLVPAEVPTTPPQTAEAPPVVETDHYLSELPRSGITPEMFRRPVSPKANLLSLFSTEDYPLQSVVNREAGTVGVVLKVGADGHVADCVITQSSGSAALDSQTCRLLWTRARFEPARDESGRPIASAWRQRIRWQLPEPTPLPIRAWSMRMTLDFVEEGGVISCKMEASGAMQEDQDSCSLFLQMSNGPFAKIRADGGYKQQRVIFETKLSPGLEASEPQPPSGMRLFARQVARLSVDESGKPLSCQVIQAIGPAAHDNGCDDLLIGTYERPGIKIGALEVTMARNLYTEE